MDPSLTRSERETLKAIYRLTRERAEAQTGALADALGVAPGTVTVTVKRLADRSLVDHRPYHGVLLTSRGRRAAVAAIRRHRIVERFLADMLGYAWNEADRLAGTFEHDLPQEVEDRIFLALDRPATCPHGFPKSISLRRSYADSASSSGARRPRVGRTNTWLATVAPRVRSRPATRSTRGPSKGCFSRTSTVTPGRRPIVSRKATTSGSVEPGTATVATSPGSRA